MAQIIPPSHIYDGEGDRLMQDINSADRVVLLPDTDAPRDADAKPKLRLMWGQNLLEDIIAGRYRTLICAVNAQDNSRGIIAQVAQSLPVSQWSASSITTHAKHFDNPNSVTVVKYDMDVVEILALLRPSSHPHLTLDDLSHGFQIVSQMISRKPQRRPSATVSFLGARTNRMVDEQGKNPSLETVLRLMYNAGYIGDVYPPTTLWESNPAGVYGRYPFPTSLQSMRDGGF